MSVTLLSSPADLAEDPSPGLFVLVQDPPADTAAVISEILSCGPPCTPAEAAETLRTGHAGVLEGSTVEHTTNEQDRVPDEADQAGAEGAEARARMAARETALERAREAAAEAVARVPARAREVAIERLERMAAAVRAAEEAVLDARTLLGERPELPAEAARAALAAEEAVIRAHQQRAIGIDRSSTLLLGANAIGILIVAGRVRTPAVEPIFVLVAAFPLTALLHLVATFGSHTWQARRAAQMRRQALRDTGMATMTGLASRNARVKAWAARADALAAAEASLAHTRRRWAALAGAPADPAHIAALLRTVADADRKSAALAELENQTVEVQVVPGLEPDPDGVPEPGPGHEVVPGLVPDPEAVPDHDPEPEAVPGLPLGLVRPRPVVVLIDGPAGQPLETDTRLLLEALDDEAPFCPVVVVTACSELGAWAGARTPRVGAEVVDLHERVMASLERLRARAATFGEPDAPSSRAADG